MPTCRDIITFAMKQARILPAGRTPKAGESDDGMFVLQGMYDAWAAQGMFGRLTDVLKTESATAEPGQRIRADGAITITIPDTRADGSDELPPYDLSLIEVIYTTTPSRELHLYEQARGDWVRIDGLTLDDEAPLATRGRDGLAACLARRYVEQFGQGTVSPTIAQLAASFSMSLILKYGGDANRTAAEYF